MLLILSPLGIVDGVAVGGVLPLQLLALDHEQDLLVSAAHQVSVGGGCVMHLEVQDVVSGDSCGWSDGNGRQDDL